MIDIPGKIGSAEDEEILFRLWRKCSTCLDTSVKVSGKYTEWCVKQLKTLLALPPVPKFKKQWTEAECKAKADSLGAVEMYVGTGHKQLCSRRPARPLMH